ncbi:HAMP domain-containing sensor histidine kinase [Neobacillus sp. PS3-40]|uniref:sensor histidine kinase n=1 Tax=Neobacillus sp. PS3-40 TaxID=3070679 RepID=UPI0027E1CDEB|nr:HAMP domain-containing sensor histidine kinase [Neobacillus sp. PS3-40]WML44789.1 HAMP domain-containing sensor histidine kinase [Neobacillus sp. PS3-40]
MFRKTKIRLVSMYTLIFFCILSILGVSLYFYMYRTSFSSIDEKLSEKAQVFKHNDLDDIKEKNERESERRVSYLFWGNNSVLLKSYPENAFFQKDIVHLSPIHHQRMLRTQSIEGHSYRILTIKTNNRSLNNEHVKLIQLVYNIEPEVSMLNNLLIMIGFGSAGGLVLSFFVGLILANRALVPIQRSWEKQSQFVADASHELRTPLSVIQTHLELLFRHPANTIEQESETIFKSLSEVKRINKLVEELLTLARSDSNEKLINPAIFPIDELIQLIIEQFEPIASMKNITIEGKVDKGIFYMGDKERIHQLFVILLDNALKFTSSGGILIITCKKEINSLKITIEDSGIGISSEDLPHIFDRFFRSDKGRRRSEGGTGLGLSIAKWIVDAHHGNISVESKVEKGTKFIIKLPIKDGFK